MGRRIRNAEERLHRAVLIGVLAGGVIGGSVMWLNSERPPSTPPETSVSAPAPSSPSAVASAPTASGQGVPSRKEIGQAALIQPKPDPYLYWIASGLAIAMLIVTIRILSLARSDEAEDSQEYRKALNAFTPAIVQRYPTPRELKRFLNQMRLMASYAWEPEKSAFQWAALLIGMFREEYKKARKNGRMRAAVGSWHRRKMVLKVFQTLRREDIEKRKAVPGREACLVYLAIKHEATNEWAKGLRRYLDRSQLRPPEDTDQSFYQEACRGLGLDPATLEPARNHDEDNSAPAASAPREKSRKASGG